MTYRERREARAARLRQWAESREQKAEQAHERAEGIAEQIPLGQPVLVGHHSERRHRRDLGRIESGYRASFEHGAKAEEFRSRAAGIEAQAERAIYSDDPDAAQRLEERIAELEAERDRIKAYNASCRKLKGDVGDLSLLSEPQRRDLLGTIEVARYQVGRHGEFPGYVLSNLGGNINRNRKRLEQLRREGA